MGSSSIINDSSISLVCDILPKKKMKIPEQKQINKNYVEVEYTLATERTSKLYENSKDLLGNVKDESSKNISKIRKLNIILHLIYLYLNVNRRSPFTLSLNV